MRRARPAGGRVETDGEYEARVVDEMSASREAIAREIGTLQAIGFSDSTIRRLFLTEGILLAGMGSLLGLAGAVAYVAIDMFVLTATSPGARWYYMLFMGALIRVVQPRHAPASSA